MVRTTWGNHYKLGYNNEWFTFRQSPLDQFEIKLDGCSRKPLGLASEAINAAAIITDEYGKDNITLLYSGGSDSEIILQSFLGYGKIPNVLFLDYKGEQNEYDKFHAVSYCKYYGIKLQIREIDPIEMLNSGEALDVAARYQCGQVGLAFYLKVIEDLCKDTYIVTGDDPYIERMHNPLENTDDWFFFAREPFYSLWKIFIKQGVDGCPNFLQYTPELWLSFFDDPIMKWLRNSQTALTNSNQVKYDIYRHRFFLKPRYKSTGMEKFGHLVHDQNQALLERHPDITNQEMKYPFNKLYHEMTRYI